ERREARARTGPGRGRVHQLREGRLGEGDRPEDGPARGGRDPGERGRGHLEGRDPHRGQGRAHRHLRGHLGPDRGDRHPPRVLEAALDHRLHDVERRRVQHGHGPALRGAPPGHRGHRDAAARRRGGAAAPRGGPAVRQDRPHPLSFRLVVVADWSAASTRGPVRPKADRCWVACGRSGEPTGREEPRYFRTRPEAEAFIRARLAEEPGRVLVGFDFAFGYPAEAGLPAGRALCARFASLVRDEAHGANNRFEVAGLLNREIQAALGGGFSGPFWCHPSGRSYETLTRTCPVPFPPRIPAGRLAERRLRGRGIQSPWKLFTAGAVGSQTLLGLPAVHRLLADPALASRARIWPFETAW